MERGGWTEQRLDDRFDHIDSELSALRQDIRDLRAEMRADSRELETGLRGEIGDLRSLMFRLHATTLVAFLGVIAVILARGG